MKKILRIFTCLFVWFFLSGLAIASEHLKSEGNQTGKSVPAAISILLDDVTKPPEPEPKHLYPFPDTGQINCYNNAAIIDCPEFHESFFGQDAQFPRIPRSYTKLKDGGEEFIEGEDDPSEHIITLDNVTGLMWQTATAGPGSAFKNSLAEARAYVDELNKVGVGFGGFDDWRIPSREELTSIIHKGAFNPAVDTDFFPIVTSEKFWSNTIFAGDPGKTWRVNFRGGFVFYEAAGSKVLSVRGPIIENNTKNNNNGERFEDNEDGTVTDHDTKLMWQKCSYGQTWETNNTCSGVASEINWEDALAEAKAADITGYNDWRMPNINELQSLVDDEDINPAIFEPFKLYTASNVYWSSTTDIQHPVDPKTMGRAWIINFDDGSNSIDTAFEGEKDKIYHMRLVRNLN